MTNQQASDVDILNTLSRADESGIPALLTGQFSTVGNIRLSNERLNERLEILAEQGHVGHQKASNRHMWWRTSEVEGGEFDAEEFDSIDYEDLDTEKIPDETKQEIASELAERNFWEREYSAAGELIKFSAVLIGWPLALSFGKTLNVNIASQSIGVIPNAILGLSVLSGTLFIIVGSLIGVPSFAGILLAKHGYVSREPLSEGLLAPLYNSIIETIDSAEEWVATTISDKKEKFKRSSILSRR